MIIGVDIGGTRTKSGLVNINTGEVLHHIVQPTEKEDAAIFLQQIKIVVNEFKQIAAAAGETIEGIGFGIPGFTEANGIVTTTYGFLAFMENYPIQSIMEKEFLMPCLIDNDARIVSLGEALYGKGKGFKRVLTLTLGTGVGFGFVADGRFIEPLPLAHMGGHIKITDKGEPCYCGKTGCLEALVSSTGIINLAKKRNGLVNELSAESIFAAASIGNAEAIEVVQEVTSYLHTAIHNYVNLFAPDMIVLGGGIAKGLSAYLNEIKGIGYLSPYPNYQFHIAVSQLEEQAGMLGSAALFKANKNRIADKMKE